MQINNTDYNISTDNSVLMLSEQTDNLVGKIQDPNNHSVLEIIKPDGSSFRVAVRNTPTVSNLSTSTNAPLSAPLIMVELDEIPLMFELPWHNCYSFFNGVESNRIRDNFNLPFINNGVKVSTVLK